jgi:hypothetical protein
MNTLLVKDLSRVDELDREASKAVRGGILTLRNPDAPGTVATMPAQIRAPWLPFPPSFPFPHASGCSNGPVYDPCGPKPLDPRAQPFDVVAV